MQITDGNLLDDTFSRLQSAEREAATSPHSAARYPTDGQALAGNYLKGRIRLHGLAITIENVRNSVRSGLSADGSRWSNRMAAAYGEFAGTRGADGDPVDVFVGPFPESRQVWVINQGWPDGGFDEHKVMLGFPTEGMARDAYLGSFDRGWQGLQSMSAANIPQLKWWLRHGDKSKPFFPQFLPLLDGAHTTMEKTHWTPDADPIGKSLQAVLYDLRRDDAGGLLLDSASLPEFMADLLDCDPDVAPAPQPLLDALVIPVARMSQRMDQLQRVMSAAGVDLKVTDYTIADPVRLRGALQVAVMFALSDGQAVTIWFHNPDTTPAKLTPLDELVSWKWLLNKKDITIVVAPERGRELNPRDVARRVMRLAEKNSAKFQEANKALAEKTALIASLDSEIGQLEGRLSEVQGQIELARQANEIRMEEESRPMTQAERDAWLTSEAGYATISGEEASLLEHQDLLDAFFQERYVAVRNALRGLGWDGDRFAPLSKDGVTLEPHFKQVGAGKKIVGMHYKLAGVEGFFMSDPLSRTPQELAELIDLGLPRPIALPDPVAQPVESVTAYDDPSAQAVRAWSDEEFQAAHAELEAENDHLSALLLSAKRFGGDGEIELALALRTERDAENGVNADLSARAAGLSARLRAMAEPAPVAKPKRVTKKAANEAYDYLAYVVDDLAGHTPLEFFKADVPARLDKPVAEVKALMDRGWPDTIHPQNVLARAEAMVGRWNAERAAGLSGDLGRGDAWIYLKDKGADESAIERILASPTSIRESGAIEVPAYTIAYLDQRVAALRPAAAAQVVGDISYRAGEMFTTFYPDSAAGEEAWRVINASPESEGGKVFNQHAAGVIEQLRAAGYSVTEASAPDMADDELLAELQEAPADAAIAALKVAREVAATNEPINREEGNDAQAELEAKTVQEIDKALEVLGSRDSQEAAAAAGASDDGESARAAAPEVVPPVHEVGNPDAAAANELAPDADTAAGIGVSPAAAADRAYLESLVDGSGDLMAPDVFERLEPMFTTYADDADMMGLLERAADAYGEASVKAAQLALAA